MTAPVHHEPPFTPRRRRLRSLKTVPILPSLVTLGNLFFGFLAMAKIADALLLAGTRPGALVFDAPVIELFEVAALFIFLAMVFDGLDGAVARLTNQSTPFGAQLDSLADVVTFGVAPAFLTKVLVEFHTQGPDPLLPPHPKLYYAAAAIYVLGAAMRLARFNVESGGPAPDAHKEFAGLPSPAAAAVVCSLIAFICAPADNRALISSRLLPAEIDLYLIRTLPILIVLLGLLMVSRFPYPHLISQLLRGRHSFPFLASIVVLVGLAAIEWQFALATLALLYVLSGIVVGFYRLLRTGRMDGRTEGDDDEAGEEPGGPELGQGHRYN
jgi:CDP-diacylglycerol--serine O-phosphatidyltransferase